jgi:CelD/BcsL family acetyltransferase involved in cellulose biosynthesis
MSVTVHQGAVALADLDGPWWALWRAAGASPFHSPAWLVPWARTFAPETAVALALWDHGRLAGLLPLFALGDRLLALGAGTTDHLGPLLAPDVGADAPARLLAAVAGVAGWRCLDFPDLDPASPLLAIGLAGCQAVDAPGRPCPVLALPRLPRHMAQNVRTARNRAVREAGGWRVEPATAAEPAFRQLVRLHGLRWARRGEPGVLADPAVLAFHRAALPRLQAAGLLRLLALRIGDTVAAVLYGLAAHGVFHHYIAGHDPAAARCSPGVLAVAGAIDLAVAEGCHSFDFLRGAEEYKHRWGAVDQPGCCRRFVRL